jgi:hypothetical protein
MDLLHKNRHRLCEYMPCFQGFQEPSSEKYQLILSSFLIETDLFLRDRNLWSLLVRNLFFLRQVTSKANYNE